MSCRGAGYHVSCSCQGETPAPWRFEIYAIYAMCMSQSLIGGTETAISCINQNDVLNVVLQRCGLTLLCSVQIAQWRLDMHVCMPSTACFDTRVPIPLLACRVESRSFKSQVPRSVAISRVRSFRAANRRSVGLVYASGRNGNPFITNKGSDPDDE